MIEVTETALITQIGLANENLTRLQRSFEIALDDLAMATRRSAISQHAGRCREVRYQPGAWPAGRHPGHGDASGADDPRGGSSAGVAEGIEDAATLEAARRRDFPVRQGYLLGRPAGTCEARGRSCSTMSPCSRPIAGLRRRDARRHPASTPAMCG